MMDEEEFALRQLSPEQRYALMRSCALECALDARDHLVLFGPTRRRMRSLRDAQKMLWSLRYEYRTGIKPGNA